MESLRINHPLGQVVKTTGHYSQSLKVGSRAYTIPPNTSIHLSLASLFTHPQYWGSDTLHYDPSRFISIPSNATATFENEVLAGDTSTHFLPWAYGQRVCPGKKFSQAETVAVLAVLFRDWVVEPVTQDGESLEDARKRVFRTGMEIEHEGKILHEMRHPRSVELIWRSRGD